MRSHITLCVSWLVSLRAKIIVQHTSNWRSADTLRSSLIEPRTPTCPVNPQGSELSKKRRGELSDHDDSLPNGDVGLEAMLYNVNTLRVFHKILDDPVARKSAFKHLVHYVT